MKNRNAKSGKTPLLLPEKPANTAEFCALTKEKLKFHPEMFALQLFPRHARLPWSPLHLRLLSLYRRQLMMTLPLEQRQPRRLAIVAPRGAAKTTLKTLILPIHAILYQAEPYIVLISATMKQAMQRLRNIKTELQRNRAIQSLYKQELSIRDAWSAKSINVNGVQIDAFSAGTELRGISYRQWRPTLVILDDVEDAEKVLSADQREKLRNWYNEDIENIGANYTAIEVIGTLLHPDSLLANLAHRPDFSSMRFCSIIQFAQRTDLWEQWRQIYTNLADEDRVQTARAFFLANNEAMLEGTRVLWPESEDYYDLQVQLVTRGRRAFFKEKQNEPTLVGEVFFDSARATRFRRIGAYLETLPPPEHANPPIGEGAPVPIVPASVGHPLFASSPKLQTSNLELQTSRAVPLSSLRIAGFLDSALGKTTAKAGADYAAIVTVGIDKAGYLYVLDTWIKRTPPSAQVSQIFNLHALWNYSIFGIESNCFQALLRQPIEDERLSRKKSNLPWQLPIREVHHSQNKELRIAALEPLLSNGWLRLDAALPEIFWQQLESFPNAEHDDALDALEGAVSLVKSLPLGPIYTASTKRESSHRLRHF